MSDRVVSTAAARQSIQKFQSIINGELLNQINALNREGQTLSDPSNWDGRLAGEFRSRWQETHGALMKMKGALEELRGQVQRINDDILRAGGNA